MWVINASLKQHKRILNSCSIQRQSLVFINPISKPLYTVFSWNYKFAPDCSFISKTQFRNSGVSTKSESHTWLCFSCDKSLKNMLHHDSLTTSCLLLHWFAAVETSGCWSCDLCDERKEKMVSFAVLRKKPIWIQPIKTTSSYYQNLLSKSKVFFSKLACFPWANLSFKSHIVQLYGQWKHSSRLCVF